MRGIGPHIILDKSVLEMLSGDEFSLLTEYFRRGHRRNESSKPLSAYQSRGH
jgi:hypothetical protein